MLFKRESVLSRATFQNLARIACFEFEWKVANYEKLSGVPCLDYYV